MYQRSLIVKIQHTKSFLLTAHFSLAYLTLLYFVWSIQMSSFVSWGLKKMIKPFPVPILRHGDKPECCKLYGTKLGKGSNHARWCFSLNYNEVGMILPSWTVCKLAVNNFCFWIQKKLCDYQRCNQCSSLEF